MADKRDRERRGGGMADTDEWLGGQQASGGWLCYKFPAKAHRFNPKEAKTYELDIAPYRATKAHPNAAVHGKLVPDCMYCVHRMVGANKDNILCPGRTYRKPCFVCEYRAKIGAGPDKDADITKALKDLQAKDRQLWNVFNHDEKEKGWQIFEYSFFLFGQNIAEKIQMSRTNDRERYKKFWHPGTAGMTLKCLGKEDTGPNSSKFINFSQIEFVERTPKVLARLEKAGEPWVLDTILRETPYPEVKRMFLAIGGGDDEDEPDEDDDTDSELEDEEDDDVEDEEGDEDDGEDDEDGDEEGEDGDEDDDEGEDEEEAVTPKVGDRIIYRWKGSKRKGTVTEVSRKRQRCNAEDADGDECEDIPFKYIIAVKDKADAKKTSRKKYGDRF